MMTTIGNFLIYFLVTVGIVLLSGRRHLARDKRLATVVWALVILLPAGQAMRRSRATYPFIRWGMYASTTPPQSYQEYLIRDDGDSVYHYAFGHIAFSSPRSFMLRLDLEELEERELDRIRVGCARLAERAREDLRRGQSDTGVPEVA